MLFNSARRLGRAAPAASGRQAVHVAAPATRATRATPATGGSDAGRRPALTAAGPLVSRPPAHAAGATPAALTGRAESGPSRTASSRGPRRLAAAAATAGALALTLAACGQADPGDDADRSPGGSTAPTSVKLVTHGSFAASDEVLAQFESETGFKLELLPTDDAGAMLNQLILTKDAPIGDAVFGIDNTFASRAIEAGILEPYKSGAAGSEAAGAGGLDVGDELTAIDQSAVCVNADRRVLPDGGSITLADLVKPEFKDKLVVENPATSSPGLAFLLATIADQGEDGWLDYWRALKANGVKIAAGWEEAYYTEFSGPSSEGSRPLVVSYSTSPAAEVPEGESEPATVYAPKTCFRQVEYAGVLKGAANPEGARLAVDFLLSDAFQADIPGQMWVYPAKASAPLPEEWVKWAELPAETFELSPEKITEKREDWLAEFADQILG